MSSQRTRDMSTSPVELVHAMLRYWRPPPHCAVHAVHAPAAHANTAQGAAPQGWLVAGGAPAAAHSAALAAPAVPGTAHHTLRACVPPPHDALHEPHAPNDHDAAAPHTEPTQSLTCGGGAPAHSTDAAPVSTRRQLTSRVVVPGPHAAEHNVHAPTTYAASGDTAMGCDVATGTPGAPATVRVTTYCPGVTAGTATAAAPADSAA